MLSPFIFLGSQWIGRTFEIKHYCIALSGIKGAWIFVLNITALNNGGARAFYKIMLMRISKKACRTPPWTSILETREHPVACMPRKDYTSHRWDDRNQILFRATTLSLPTWYRRKRQRFSQWILPERTLFKQCQCRRSSTNLR